MRPIKLNLKHQLIAALAFVLGNSWIPYAWNARQADQWYEGDTELQSQLANGVECWMTEELGRDDFTTGSKQFDGEWLYGTYVMAAMGFGQMAQQHPEQKDHYLSLMENAIEELLSDRVRAFDIERWKSDPLKSLDTLEGHAAYLGYLNLAMGFHRKLNTKSRFTKLNDRISIALRRRIEASPSLLLPSYPHETYPVDNCAVMASVALHGTFDDEFDDLPGRWAGRCRRKYIDPQSGLLYQAVDGATGEPFDYPRSSGTTLGLYFLSFMDMQLSEDLYQAIQQNLIDHIAGFGFVREYPSDIHGQHGDIDSGMVIFGYGLSPTGFAISGARLHADEKNFKHLYATANAAGCPRQRHGKLNFVTGASLGDAILFAMLTAQPGGSGR